MHPWRARRTRAGKRLNDPANIDVRCGIRERGVYATEQLELSATVRAAIDVSHHRRTRRPIEPIVQQVR
jgi:hypothetical protein